MLLNKLKWAATLLAAVGFMTVGSGAPAVYYQESKTPTEANAAGDGGVKEPVVLARGSGRRRASRKARGRSRRV